MSLDVTEINRPVIRCVCFTEATTAVRHEMKWFALGATPSHVSILPNQNGTVAKVDCCTETLISAECVSLFRRVARFL